MEYISSDTNIWLDFNAISMLDLPFRMPCTYVMYKEALRKEVLDPPELLEGLKARGVIGVELSVEEFFYAGELANKYVKLSGYDRTALAIAKFRGIPLMTGDAPLRKAALREGVEIFGTIGLLDRLYEGGHIHMPEYKFCLENLLKHKERRLPADEIQKRINDLQ